MCLLGGLWTVEYQAEYWELAAERWALAPVDKRGDACSELEPSWVGRSPRSDGVRQEEELEIDEGRVDKA